MPKNPTSLWKAYGINVLPGGTIDNNFVSNTHGGLRERSEGFGSYVTKHSFQNRFADGGNSGAVMPPAPPIQRTTYPNVYMRNDYDTAAAYGQAGYDPMGGYLNMYSPKQQQQQFNNGTYNDPQLLRAAMYPVKRSYHTGNTSTQSSASRHRLAQRYMGSANYEWNNDPRTDANTTHVSPTADMQYNNMMTRESDAMVQQEQQDMWRKQNAAMLMRSQGFLNSDDSSLDDTTKDWYEALKKLQQQVAAQKTGNEMFYGLAGLSIGVIMTLIVMLIMR